MMIGAMIRQRSNSEHFDPAQMMLTIREAAEYGSTGIHKKLRQKSQ